MAFELYFNISRTAVEIIALGVIVGAGVYIVKDLMEEETIPEINYTEG